MRLPCKVTPFLKDEEGIISWNVDTINPNKVLTVQTDRLSGNEIVATVKEAGFKIEPLDHV